MLKRLKRCAAVVLFVAACAAGSAHCRGGEQRVDPDAELQSFAQAELTEGQRLLNAREPALEERVRLARLHFANAEAVLVLPRDARTLAELQVWLGIAEMQLAQASQTPGPQFERARDYFRVARELFASVQATSEVEGVDHLLRRSADEEAHLRP
ncbi:MAG: hypothetical protein HYY76_14600 [Acidobacteria bacterium]|nr:hypothetical protein [Acidobacteriota bacterium]